MGARLASVSPRQWLGLTSAVLALVACALPWTYLTADNPAVQAALGELPPGDVARSPLRSGFLGWAPPLILVVTGLAAAAFGQSRVARASGLAQVWLVAAGVAVVLLVIGWFAMPAVFGTQQRAFLADSGVSINGGVGRYLGCFAALVSVIGACLDIRAGREYR